MGTLSTFCPEICHKTRSRTRKPRQSRGPGEVERSLRGNRAFERGVDTGRAPTGEGPGAASGALGRRTSPFLISRAVTSRRPPERAVSEYQEGANPEGAPSSSPPTPLRGSRSQMCPHGGSGAPRQGMDWVAVPAVAWPAPTVVTAPSSPCHLPPVPAVLNGTGRGEQRGSVPEGTGPCWEGSWTHM